MISTITLKTDSGEKEFKLGAFPQFAPDQSVLQGIPGIVIQPDLKRLSYQWTNRNYGFTQNFTLANNPDGSFHCQGNSSNAANLFRGLFEVLGLSTLTSNGILTFDLFHMIYNSHLFLVQQFGIINNKVELPSIKVESSRDRNQNPLLKLIFHCIGNVLIKNKERLCFLRSDAVIEPAIFTAPGYSVIGNQTGLATYPIKHHVLEGDKQRGIQLTMDAGGALVLPRLEMGKTVRVPIKSGTHVIGVSDTQLTLFQ